jgi:hypothetical protein
MLLLITASGQYVQQMKHDERPDRAGVQIS